MRMITYAEVDIEVTASGDLVLHPNGDLRLAAPSGVLKQDVAFRLKTDNFDFTPHPDLGANLSSLVGEQNTRATSLKGEQMIVRSLTSDARIFPGDLMVKGVPVGLYNIAYYVYIRDGMSTLNVTPDMVLDMNRGILSY
jgi:hypothetical protein